MKIFRNSPAVCKEDKTLADNTDRPNTRSVSNTSFSTSTVNVSGPGKGSGKNKRGKGPTVKKTFKRKPENVPVQGNIKRSLENFLLVTRVLNRSKNNDTSCSVFNNRESHDMRENLFPEENFEQSEFFQLIMTRGHY